MSEQKLMNNAKEAAVLVALSASFGFLAKKVLKKSITNDPSADFMNAATWVVVMFAALYVRDYLIANKILPS